MSIRIAIAVYHTLTRKGLVELLNKHGDFIIEIEAHSGQELVDQYTQKPTAEICLVDTDLPNLNGIETTRLLKAQWPQLKVLTLSSFNNDHVILRVLESAADGYLHKSCTPEELYKALTVLYNNNIYYPQNILHKATSLKNTSLHTHSSSEMEFIKYCCSEMTYKEIANKMNVSARTIDNYREALFKRL